MAAPPLALHIQNHPPIGERRRAPLNKQLRPPHPSLVFLVFPPQPTPQAATRLPIQTLHPPLSRHRPPTDRPPRTITSGLHRPASRQSTQTTAFPTQLRLPISPSIPNQVQCLLSTVPTLNTKAPPPLTTLRCFTAAASRRHLLGGAHKHLVLPLFTSTPLPPPTSSFSTTAHLLVFHHRCNTTATASHGPPLPPMSSTNHDSFSTAGMFKSTPTCCVSLSSAATSPTYTNASSSPPLPQTPPPLSPSPLSMRNPSCIWKPVSPIFHLGSPATPTPSSLPISGFYLRKKSFNLY